MKVLWFEVTIPGQYKDDGSPVGGWQDSLEYIVKQHKDIELYIAFEGRQGDSKKIIDGITYIPITAHYSLKERIVSRWSYRPSRIRLLALAKNVVEEVCPDVIHVFGSEWCWGQVQQFTNIPVVIHMQGSMPPYHNAEFPPGYSLRDVMHLVGLNIKGRIGIWLGELQKRDRVIQEEDTLGIVNFYMGRTAWDRTIVKLYNPAACYYYCSEALRPSFTESSLEWHPHDHAKIRIVTTGMTSLLKGLDTILRTAKRLKHSGLDFEWICAGKMDGRIKKLVESKEGSTYEENSVQIAGMLDSEKLTQLLLSADMYVHTAYIDNSPNAVCEAQLLGLPVIATFVGGIPSLINDGVDGLLVPANAPFTMASKIITLSRDKKLQRELGGKAREKALERHNPDIIYNDLLTCYRKVIEESSTKSSVQ